VKEIVISTQAEFDALPKNFEEFTKIVIRDTKFRISVVARENSSVEAWGNSSVVARGNSSVVARENSSVVARGNSSVVAWGNSSVVARGNSSVVARENSSVEAWENSSVVAWGNSSVVARENSSVVARENSSVVARENSSVVAWENSSVEAWGNSSVVARENSSVVARENSSVVARENSSVEARGNSVVRAFSNFSKIVLFGFSVAIVIPSITVKIEKKSEHAYIQHVQEQGWFERNGVDKTPTVILYKRVSHDFKTQENTENETVWTIGSTVTHPAWNPKSEECGKGKFHACSKPYFCDEFRTTPKDRYIALSVKLEDTHAWEENPQYPYKIALKEAKVLYECNRFGKEI
jgi:hypothetical protein